MSNEIQQITPFDGYGSDVAVYNPHTAAAANARAAAPGPEAAPQAGMARKIHNSLRGRYWIGLIIGSVLGAAGGIFGFKSQQPIYRGEGMVRIAMMRPIGDVRSNEGGWMPNFEEYIQSQAMLIGSRRVIDTAVRSHLWEATGLPSDLTVKNLIAQNLGVEHPSRTELIKVYYTDKNPEVAGNVVRAVIAAYAEYSTNKVREDDSKRLDVLTKSRNLSLEQMSRLDREILAETNLFGMSDLAGLVEAKLQEEIKIQSRLNECELALGASLRKKDIKQTIKDLTENQIAMIDQTMRQHVMERDAVATEIAKLTSAGVLPGNTKMKQLQTLLEIQQKNVDNYAAQWRDLQVRLVDDPSLGSGGIQRAFQVSPAVLEGEVKAMKQKIADIQLARTDLGRHMLNIEDLKRRREKLDSEGNDLLTRINQLRIEGMLAGRLTIENPGDVPIAPFKDRRKMVGAVGAVGGFGLPMGILVLLGLLDKRYRYSDEANDGIGNVPLLGILPRLPDTLSDPEQAAVAAHCIHQIRIMLQVGQNPDKRRAFMITSASTGDGKTSLTLALGLSFAASGSKTLVIDCDMVGQGLTHRLKAHGVPGLIETLNLGTLRGHVRKTASKGLYILPIGMADSVHAGVLSPQSIKRLLAACREHFDIVVIDTGPILGSLEASVVAAEVDGVIVAVARGQQQPLVEKAVKHLRAIGANIFGIVFNRAEHRDFQRSVPSASIRSQSARPMEQRTLLPESDESARFGPLALSVASSVPTSPAAAAGAGNGNGGRNANVLGNGHGRGNGNGHGEA